VRLALLLGATLTLAIASAPSCLVDRKSKDFECSDSMACPSDRLCENGFCVLANPNVCGVNCTDAGGQCTGAICTFECATASCPAIVCPGQLACTINCNASDACTDTSITCGSSSRCTINCSGPDSCGSRLVTGTGQTTVTCGGTGSCAGGVDCDDACSCTVNCNGTGSCATPADCHGSSVQCADGNGCSLGGNCQNDC
jgi:hypothetical protein